MKPKHLFTSLAVLPLIAPIHVFAQATWTGVGTSVTPVLWSDSANWTGTPPTNGSTISGLTFANTTNSFSTNDLTGLTVAGISIPGTGPTLDNTITGNSFVLSGDVTIGTGNWQTINTGIGLTGNRTFAVNNGQLTLGGNLTNGTTAGSIFKTGTGSLILKGAGSITGGNTQTVTAGTPGAGIYNVPLVFNSGSAGRVVLQNAAALGSASLRGVQFHSDGGGTLDLQTDTSVNGYGIFAGSGGGVNTIITNRLTTGAGITHNLGVLQLGSTTLAFNSGSNVTSGTAGVSFSSVSLTAGNTHRVVRLEGNAAISLGSVASTANAGNNRRLGLDGTSANNTVTGVISNLAAGVSGTSVLSLIKSNSSTWTLGGANTYTGVTTIAGGTLQIGNGGATGSLSASSAIQNGGTLAFHRTGTITQGTDFASTIGAYTTDYTSNSDGVALAAPVLGVLRKASSGNLILTGANTLAAANSLTFSGVGSGTVTLRNTAALGAAGNMVRFSGGGSGVLDLQTDTSVNAYSITSGSGNGGTLVINRATSGASVTHQLGILDLSSVTVTANKGSNVTGTAAVSFTEVRMTGGNDDNPVTLAGTADITLGSASITLNGFSKRLRLDGTSANNSVTGAISNTSNATSGAMVNVIKSNTSTWTLSGENSYTGTTSVQGGTLLVNGALTQTSLTTVDAGATLGGSGSIASGVNVTGVLSPGNGVGSFGTGSLNLLNNSFINYQIHSANADGDLLNIAGNFSIGNNVTLSLADLGGGSLLGLNTKLTLASYSGTWNGGTFKDLTNGSTFLLGSNEWRIKYDDTIGGANLAGSGSHSNFVTLTVVPEVSSSSLAMLAAAGIMLRRRRQR